MIKLSRGMLPSKTKCHFLYFELTCFWMGQENKGKSHIEGILKNKEFLDSRFYMCLTGRQILESQRRITTQLYLLIIMI